MMEKREDSEDSSKFGFLKNDAFKNDSFKNELYAVNQFLNESKNDAPEVSFINDDTINDPLKFDLVKEDPKQNTFIQAELDGEKVEYNTFEKLLELVGTTGRWNYLVFFMCASVSFFSPLQSLSYQFLGRTPQHWCQVKPLMDANWTQSQILSLAIPFSNVTGQYESCDMYDYNYSHAAVLGYEQSIRDPDRLLLQVDTYEDHKKTVPCRARYFNSTYSSTVTQWDLVCERRPLYSTTFSASHSIRFISSVFQGHLLDTFGRRRCVVVCACLFTVCGFLAAVAPTLQLYLALRVLISIFDNYVYIGCYILGLEVYSRKQRSMMGNLFAVPWAVGYMVLPGIAYLVYDWYWLQAALTLPAIFMFSYFWLLPESPRWLVMNGRFKQALKILTDGARMNGNILPSDSLLLHAMNNIHNRNIRETEEGRKHSVSSVMCLVKMKHFFIRMWSLVHTVKMARITTIIFFCWFTASTTYYGISLNSVNLSTNEYIYMFLCGAMELPSYFLLWPAVSYCGRRNTNILLYLVSAISILFIPLLQVITPQGPSEVRVLFSLLGKLAVTSAYQLAYLYTGELYPTQLRSLAISLATVFTSAGATAAPFINDILVTEAWWAPSVVFGGFSLAAALLTTFLPETNNEDLPETEEDV
ncbi:hypothetical protein OTU49_000229 [Cherax quadricarinatus]|uniref:Major facilitator superfamily (MFS) profile domain-containing protein n=1 Tax=Cherax quadricarinatus TaxID=27406 RepID=A0AAW0YPS6_CHEQU